MPDEELRQLIACNSRAISETRQNVQAIFRSITQLVTPQERTNTNLDRLNQHRRVLDQWQYSGG